MVYVTHDQSEALTMSDRIAVFNDGIVQQLAKPADLYERPSNAFVAQFIGENNKLLGTVKALNGDTAVVEFSNGQQAEALAVNCEGVGKATLCSIRPERVRIGAQAGPYATNGKVIELIYLGDHIRCRMSVYGDESFIVKIPNAGDGTMLSVGQTVKVGWDKNDCRALDA